MALSDSEKAQFEQDGYILIRQVLEKDSLADLENKFLGLLERWSGNRFSSAQDPALAQLLLNNRELERRLYNEIRTFSWTQEFSLSPEISDSVTGLLGGPLGLMSKIPFRIDLPQVTRELAVWHQDFHYVRGNENVITAWIPFQDTPYIRGCLMVMPGSHRLGPVKHDGEILGKRHFPSGIFNREVRYVEMKHGDLLLFHSLMLHSSGINISPTVRLSLQPRYTLFAASTDPSMGDVIPVPMRPKS